MKNWKTTLSGLICLVFGGWMIIKGMEEIGGLAVVAGLGLLGAKDSNVTGGTKKQ